MNTFVIAALALLLVPAEFMIIGFMGDVLRKRNKK